MRSFKLNGITRLISFVLITVLLIFIVGFAANGWQSQSDSDNKNNVENQNNPSEKNETNDTPPLTDNTEPKFISVSTGLEINEELYNANVYSFVVNSQSPFYGISNSDLSIEFGMEDGSSRILNYTNDISNLWKIGSLLPTRKYITEISKLFGGTIVSYGNENAEQNNQVNNVIDLSKFQDSFYKENGNLVYTSNNAIYSITSQNDAITCLPYMPMPFLFSDEDETIGKLPATTAIIQFSEDNETELYYSSENGTYRYFKCATKKIDMLSGADVEYKNIFVLFADSTTYETTTGCETVYDVYGGGKGYYISEGLMTEFNWNIDENEKLIFTALNGKQLIVNRGNSYIAYYKSSQTQKIKIF